MKKPISTIAFFAASALCCAACSDNPYTPENENGDNTPQKTVMQTTTPVPPAYFQSAAEQGRVELMHYESKDYTRADRPTTRKPAYIYLPTATMPRRNTTSSTCYTAGRALPNNTSVCPVCRR